VSAARDEELRDALERCLAGRSGERRAIVGFERRPCPYRTSFELDELDVELAGGERLALVFKNGSRSTLDAEASRAKLTELHDPEREIAAYRLVAPAGLGTPELYGWSIDPSRDRYWLFIERIHGDVLWQVGELETWRAAARWLATFHERFAGAPLDGAAAHLIRHDVAFYSSWMERAARFAQAADSPLDGTSRDAIERLAQGYGEVAKELAAQPQTLLHGEFYASNVLVESAPDSLRICPIDWENAALGPGLADLAALTAGAWSQRERDEIARGYAEGLAAAGTAVDEPELLRKLDLFRLHVAVQWLGWEPAWTPPAEHRHDWLREAVETAARLGL
jgi:aminoglycoside phosphotransferase (APT) family kinase protein